MLNGDDKRTTMKMGSRLTDLISKKKKQIARAAHFFFSWLARNKFSLAVVLHDYNAVSYD